MTSQCDIRLVLRVLPPADPENPLHMGDKFGATMSDGKKLLVLAKSLELDVVGIRYYNSLDNQSFLQV